MADDKEREEEEARQEELRQEQEESRKPGQKYPQPSPGAGDRVFYESLLEQRPDSLMAMQWCVEYGVLSKERAVEIYKELLKSKGKSSVSTASARSAPKSPKEEKKDKKSKKRKHTSSSSNIIAEPVADAGMVVGSMEGIGMGGI
jgi:hypothetical protein